MSKKMRIGLCICIGLVLVIVSVGIWFCLKRGTKSSDVLPEKDGLKISEDISIESITRVGDYLKIKFSNKSQKKYYLEARGVERFENNIWETISYTKPSHELLNRGGSDETLIYRIVPNDVWKEHGFEDDTCADVLTEKEHTFEVKTMKENFDIREEGKYRIFYVVSDKEGVTEIVSREFQVEEFELLIE